MYYGDQCDRYGKKRIHLKEYHQINAVILSKNRKRGNLKN